MGQKHQHSQFRTLLILGGIWFVAALCDRFWFALDRSVPAWDEADYLTGTLNYWQALQHPQWFSGEWWTHFWQLSSKIPPFNYILTGIVQNLFGTGPEQATLVHLLYSAILLGSVYTLGVQLFNRQVGLWAAGLTVLFPGLYRYRLEFLLDFPLTAVVAWSFCCLTLWRNQRLKVEASQGQFTPNSLVSAAVFGLSLGVGLMVKQTALFFLFIPILWLLGGAIRQRSWGRLAELMASLCLSVLIFGPWYRTNWLLILTSGKRATLDSAIAEGDPPLNTLAAWTYYWKVLPDLVSWLLLLVPIVGLILYWRRREIQRDKETKETSPPHPILLSSLTWLAVFWVGGYFLSSLNMNKHDRYILPLLPILSLVLAYGLLQWKGRWGNPIRWGTVGLASLFMVFNLFPLGGTAFLPLLSAKAYHQPYRGAEWPHTQVIDEIIQTSPYLRTTLGVLPSTPDLNQHNLNYFGALRNFQVYGRQVGVRQKQVQQDTRSLSWFVTKTGEQGSIPEAQTAMVQAVEQSTEFGLHKTWNLPDGSILNLYHRLEPLIEVKPDSPLPTPHSIHLAQVTVPEKTPPGVPVPVTYEWTGSWEPLQSGIVLLTWHSKDGTSQHRWLHDHGIGMGELHPQSRIQGSNSPFRVIERMAMLPPGDIPPGTYTLEATYLNRETGETYPIPVPPVTLSIDPGVAATPAPELDLLTQLRTLAANLPQGQEALEPIFAETGRINQYDPIQDYLVQADLALAYRLQLEPENLDWAYTLALSKVLQVDTQGAIAALQRVVQIDSQNPYAHAYLAFVYLYEWRGKNAQNALKPALALNPNLPELQALSGVAALLRGHVFNAWHFLEEFRRSSG